MVLVISQETFDAAVKENMEEFQMTPEEAVKEAIEQFTAQGVDLGHIITDAMNAGPNEIRAVNGAVNKLAELVQAFKTSAEYLEQLEIIKTECDKGMQYRILAGKAGAYNCLLDILTKFQDQSDVIKATLKTLTSLMTKQPDLLNERGVTVIIDYLDKNKDQEVQRLLLKWVKECCILHELNRQQIFNAGILEHLKPHLDDEASTPLLRDVLGVLRGLILDDDVRVEFGKAHEHAKAIAGDTLLTITALLKKHKNDEPLMNDLMLTLSALLVRAEFCKQVEEAGALELIKDVMKDFHDNEKLIRQCFLLVRSLAGNDDSKIHFLQQKDAPKILIAVLGQQKKSPKTAAAGLACIAALTLRCPENSKALFEAGIPQTIIEIMKQHPENTEVQKGGSWAIRNMVSRSRYQNQKFLELGVEDILQKNLRKFVKFEFDMKAALRDLGCNVNLKEEWTGKGGLLHTDENQ